jgi:hypothetical protein
MTTENQVSPDAETQNPAPETAIQQPEVASPEAVESEQTQSQEPQETEEAKALKAMKRRIDKRTADVYRERAEKEQLARRLQELESKLQPQDDKPVYDEQTITQKALEIAKVARVAEQSNTVYTNGKKQFPDFDDALAAVVAEAGPLIDKAGLPTALGQVVLESDVPHAVLHYLGKNPDVAAELADLTPTQLARRMVSIEAKATAKPQVSTAPKPLSAVKPTATTNDLSPDLPVDEWMARREKQLREKRGY